MPRSAGGRRKCVREEMRRVASHVTRNRRGQAPRWGAGVRRCLARPTGLLSADRGKRGSGGARSSRQGWDGGWDGTGKGGMEPARLWLGPARAQYRRTARWRRSSRGSSSRPGRLCPGRWWPHPLGSSPFQRRVTDGPVDDWPQVQWRRPSRAGPVHRGHSRLISQSESNQSASCISVSPSRTSQSACCIYSIKHMLQ